MDSKGYQIIISTGPNDVNKVLLGLSIALSALAVGKDVYIYFSMDGAYWPLNYTDKTAEEINVQVRDLLEKVIDSGGVIEICSACVGDSCSLSAACTEKHGFALVGLTKIVERLSQLQVLSF